MDTKSESIRQYIATAYTDAEVVANLREHAAYLRRINDPQTDSFHLEDAAARLEAAIGEAH
jgi:hypothetical protein